jgi:hypothetical protein
MCLSKFSTQVWKVLKAEFWHEAMGTQDKVCCCFQNHKEETNVLQKECFFLFFYNFSLLIEHGPMLWFLKNCRKNCRLFCSKYCCFCQNRIITLFSKKNAIYWRKSQKIVIITLTPDQTAFLFNMHVVYLSSVSHTHYIFVWYICNLKTKLHNYVHMLSKQTSFFEQQKTLGIADYMLQLL